MYAYWLLFILLPLHCFSCPEIGELTLEEKVGQLFMVHFHGEEANDAARTLIQQAHIGNIIYYRWSNSLHSPEQVLSLSNSLQALAAENPNPIPLLIAVDQEGGVVNRLRKGFTLFPSSGAQGKTGLPEMSRLTAQATGEELKAVGINMVLGPVVDVATNPYNPVIGIRAYGSSPATVIAHARAALEGYQSSHLLTAIKHYPGHGDVAMDSHAGLPIVDKPLEQLYREELLPFQVLGPQADAVMTAHLLVPSLDPFRCATLSPIILERLLREKMGFQGVVISDSLVMQGVLSSCSDIAEAAIRAFEAGCDLLILGGKELFNGSGYELTVEETLAIYQEFLDALKSGRISEKRLDAAVGRILAMKHRHRLCSRPSPCIEELEEQLNSNAHCRLAKEIAERAMQAERPRMNSAIDFSTKRVAVFSPSIVRDDVQNTSLMKIGSETQVFFFDGLKTSSEELLSAGPLICWADAFIVCTYNAWNYIHQQEFIDRLLAAGKPVAVLVLRDPVDCELMQKADIVISTSSPDPYSIQSAVDLLELNSSICRPLISLPK